MRGVDLTFFNQSNNLWKQPNTVATGDNCHFFAMKQHIVKADWIMRQPDKYKRASRRHIAKTVAHRNGVPGSIEYNIGLLPFCGRG